MVPTFLSLVLAGQATNPLMVAQTVEDPLRLAHTPIMDGVVSDQEWEPFTDTPQGPTFFQWEPGKFFWAAKAEMGKDLVLTLDADGDGWLVGKDNLEIRCRLEGSDVKTTVRQLDATDRNGPKWIDPDVIPESFKIAAKASDDYWNLEVSFAPIQFTPGPQENRRIGVRMDILPPNQESGPGYMPRALNFITMRFDDSKGLFSGLTWRPQVKTRSLSRFDRLQFRFNFEADQDCPPLQTVELSGEGAARNLIKSLTVPFPGLDGKGRAKVDYDSEIAENSPSGYRVLRAAVVANDGRIALIRTSFRIAGLVDLDPNFKMELPFSESPQRVKGGLTVRSQSLGKVEGSASIRYPAAWTSIGKLDQNFLIYHSKGAWRMPIEFEVPANTRGVFPIVLSAKVGTESIVQTVYVTVGK